MVTHGSLRVNLSFYSSKGYKNCVKLENWTSTPGDATWRLVSSSEVKTLLENLQDNVTESSQSGNCFL